MAPEPGAYRKVFMKAMQFVLANESNVIDDQLFSKEELDAMRYYVDLLATKPQFKLIDVTSIETHGNPKVWAPGELFMKS